MSVSTDVPRAPHQPGARHALLISAALMLSACSTFNDVTTPSAVKPWERDALAREDMQIPADSSESAIDDHIYFSKEASTGGSGIRGGGCGCN